MFIAKTGELQSEISKELFLEFETSSIFPFQPESWFPVTCTGLSEINRRCRKILCFRVYPRKPVCADGENGTSRHRRHAVKSHLGFRNKNPPHVIVQHLHLGISYATSRERQVMADEQNSN